MRKLWSALLRGSRQGVTISSDIRHGIKLHVRRAATSSRSNASASSHRPLFTYLTPARAAAFTTVNLLIASLYYQGAVIKEKSAGIGRQYGDSIQYADQATMLKAVQELKIALAATSNSSIDEIVTTDPDVLQDHSYSEWSTSNSPVQPVAVVYPTTTSQVSIIARTCSKHRVPMIPYGAGSSVEGSFSAPHSGITIDFSRMNKIIALHEDDMDVVVQPGVNWVGLNKEIAHAGLFLPLDPSPTALIGGMIATNCSGTNAMRYGTMKDWVINVTAVLADGTVLKTRRRPRKSSAGYDLTKLFVGSEGTLGIVTEATLKLAVLPKETGVATASFPTVKSACEAAVGMMREGITGLAALEIMDEMQMQVINKNGGAGGRKWKEEPHLFLKLAGTQRTMDDDAKRISDITRRYGATKLEFAVNDAQKNAIWSARKEALWAMLAQRDEGTEIWSTDVAVPLSRLAEIVDISKQEGSELGLFNTVLGHVGDGNWHSSIMYHPDDETETAAVAQVVRNTMNRAMDMDGTVSGEHAIGIGKKKSLEKEVGNGSMDMMRRLKFAVDPFWLMNPGKVFDYKSGEIANP